MNSFVSDASSSASRCPWAPASRRQNRPGCVRELVRWDAWFAGDPRLVERPPLGEESLGGRQVEPGERRSADRATRPNSTIPEIRIICAGPSAWTPIAVTDLQSPSCRRARLDHDLAGPGPRALEEAERVERRRDGSTMRNRGSARRRTRSPSRPCRSARARCRRRRRPRLRRRAADLREQGLVEGRLRDAAPALRSNAALPVTSRPCLRGLVDLVERLRSSR